MSRWIVAVLLMSPALAIAGNWPAFRGPHADGHADATGLPITWSETENIRWKAAIPGKGWSSPVVWDNQVWVTTAQPDAKKLFALCLDRATGRIVHDVLVFDEHHSIAHDIPRCRIEQRVAEDRGRRHDN